MRCVVCGAAARYTARVKDPRIARLAVHSGATVELCRDCLEAERANYEIRCAWLAPERS